MRRPLEGWEEGNKKEGVKPRSRLRMSREGGCACAQHSIHAMPAKAFPEESDVLLTSLNAFLKRRLRAAPGRLTEGST